MARTRTIRPTFWSSFTVGQLGRDARLLFIGLWSEADDEGRLIDSPKALAGALYPHDEDVSAQSVRGWLDELEEVGAVKRYSAKGGQYLYIPSWLEHQKPPHPTPSKLPPPPGKPRRISRKTPEPDVKPQEKASMGLGSCLGLGSSSSPETEEPPPTSPVEEDRTWQPPKLDDPPEFVVYRDACRLIAERRLARRSGPPVVNPAAWVQTAAEGIWSELYDRWFRVTGLRRYESSEALANKLEPPNGAPGPNVPKPFEKPDEPDFDPEAGKARLAEIRTGRMAG